MNRNVIYLVVLILFSCKSSPNSSYEELDLLSYGMPIEILAPPGADVKTEDLGVIKGVIVRSDENNYNVQVYSSNALTIDIDKAKRQLVEDVKKTRYFSKILEEEDQGFIFEKDIDGTIIYDFRYIKILGDQEYIFQKGLMGTYTEEEVRNMYEAVK